MYTDHRDALEGALDEYEDVVKKAVREGRLTRSAGDLHIRYARRLAQWVDGEYVPGRGTVKISAKQ